MDLWEIANYTLNSIFYVLLIYFVFIHNRFRRVHSTNNWWRFHKFLWPSQNIWTLMLKHDQKVSTLRISWNTFFFLNDLFLYLVIYTVFHPSGIIQNGRRKNFFKLSWNAYFETRILFLLNELLSERLREYRLKHSGSNVDIWLWRHS